MNNLDLTTDINSMLTNKRTIFIAQDKTKIYLKSKSALIYVSLKKCLKGSIKIRPLSKSIIIVLKNAL